MKSNFPVNILIPFVENSPTCFHVISNVRAILNAQDFTELRETEKWELKTGGKYFVTRNNSSLIAFTIPENGIEDYRIIASHSDFPCFKVKEDPEIAVEKHYKKLNVEKYGGMLMATWLDRPLSIAGRIFVDTEYGIREVLVDIDRDLVLIPNLAIHMNKEANEGYKYNAQKDMLPLFGDISTDADLFELIAAEVPCDKKDILGHDLFLYNRQKASIWGGNHEYLSAPRLDDLECAYGSLLGFINGSKTEHAAVYCVFDNEEVGSGTRQGAASTFLADTVKRICEVLHYSQEEYMIQLAKSFFVSADNAHAVHPNHTDKSDPVNKPYLNEGIVLKFNGNQRYCTDGASSAFFKKLCKANDIPVQMYTNRSDLPGGSTLGNIASTLVPVPSVDIGLPQLAMHSSYETVGTKDWNYFLTFAEAFYT